jgi:hypothetical protein
MIPNPPRRCMEREAEAGTNSIEAWISDESGDG